MDLSKLDCRLLTQHNNKVLLDCNNTNTNKQTKSFETKPNFKIKRYSPSNIPSKLKLSPSPVYGMV